MCISGWLVMWLRQHALGSQPVAKAEVDLHSLWTEDKGR